MKRLKIYILLAGLLPISMNAIAQNASDAFRYSHQSGEGTARSVAMGNAFTALGGDLGAVSINPAASGVYRYSELVLTPSLNVATNKTGYLGTSSSENRTRFGIANFGYVGSFATGRRNNGLINWNIAVTFNRTNNFNSRMSASGQTDKSSWLASLAQETNGIHATNMDMNDYNDPFYRGISWSSILGWNTSLLDTLPDSGTDYRAATENISGYDIGIGGALDQRYFRESTGNISEAVLNFGGNISNKLFFGFNIGIQSIWYKYSEYYSETAVNSVDFQTGFSHFSRNYRQTTSGTGVNLKAGIIYLPVQGLRLGAAISTPTWLFLNEEWEESMSSDFNDGYSQELLSPLGSYNYRVNTPFRWNVGAAYTLGKIGAISVDYEQSDYSRMKLSDPDDSFVFNDENQYIKSGYRTSHLLRAGLEARIHPQMAFRAGYQWYNYRFEKGYTANTRIGSLGLGYSGKSGFFADVAYQQLLQKAVESFRLYNDVEGYEPAPEGISRTGNWKLLLSVGFRF